MGQAAFADGQLLDLSPALDDGAMTPEVDVGRGEVAEALVVAPVVVPIDEGADLRFQVSGQVVVLQQDAVLQPAADMELPGTVKFYDPARGFGFVVPDAGGREVFVHASVLLRSGLADLQQGQRVLVRPESVPRGLQATEKEPI